MGRRGDTIWNKTLNRGRRDETELFIDRTDKD